LRRKTVIDDDANNDADDDEFVRDWKSTASMQCARLAVTSNLIQTTS